ncbi:PEP-CTERM sorting domain-containing protein [Thalassotalea agarivorans]|uniref:PEP-CTERM protein-sorting domain-containing protein n=1 Tax=Thalassotalea agarivorans TaxID=349064 RepID=A0A1I0H4N4_THASX|nr:PEP-CTERM sorting domain-containing protein [Thalassotalea agarivorans]SET78584.1 PEP-CTERM protein-sorting domain-containing protein [Thalassotalea agarivorans]
MKIVNKILASVFALAISTQASAGIITLDTETNEDYLNILNEGTLTTYSFENYGDMVIGFNDNHVLFDFQGEKTNFAVIQFDPLLVDFNDVTSFAYGENLGYFFDSHMNVMVAQSAVENDSNFKLMLEFNDTFQIDAISIDESGGDSQSGIMYNDFSQNVRFGNVGIEYSEYVSNAVDVPEPSSLAIFGLSILGLVSRRFGKNNQYI